MLDLRFIGGGIADHRIVPEAPQRGHLFGGRKEYQLPLIQNKEMVQQERLIPYVFQKVALFIYLYYRLEQVGKVFLMYLKRKASPTDQHLIQVHHARLILAVAIPIAQIIREIRMGIHKFQHQLVKQQLLAFCFGGKQVIDVFHLEKSFR